MKRFIVWATCSEEDKEVNPEDLDAIKNAEHSFSKEYDTVEEANAFVDGLEAANGWMGEPIWQIHNQKEGVNKGLPTTISITWSLEDIKQRANEIMMDENPYVKFDETKYPEVLRLLEEKHDANIGINWDVIDMYLIQYAKILEE